MSPQDGGREGWILGRMSISQGFRRDSAAQNDAGGSLAEAEAEKAEASTKLRAERGGSEGIRGILSES